MNPEERERIIVRTSVIGIVANVLLVAFKAVATSSPVQTHAIFILHSSCLAG